ncbi:MAG: DUF2459 domain-containing protein [Armatimonadetes bacterium]|nr:DUF2459 domain-containing protein [Akkermansiaceae bacterium]
MPNICKLPAIVALAGLIASCNFITLPPAPAPAPDLIRKTTVSSYTPERPPHVQVWLIADKLHTGMVYPYDWLIESGFIPPENFPEAKYVTLSWGNRNAYMNKRWLTPIEVFNAIFTPSPSVMELIPINWDITEVSPNQHIWMKLIPRQQGPYVATFLNHCTVSGSDGRPVIAGASSWGGGVLLDSPHAYYFPRICNVWTGQALESCGANINPVLSIHRDLLVHEAVRNDFAEIWDGSGNKYIPLSH